MQFKGYKIQFVFCLAIFLTINNGVKAQVFGENFYLTYDYRKYDLEVFGLDIEYSKEYQKLITEKVEIRDKVYEELLFRNKKLIEAYKNEKKIIAPNNSNLVFETLIIVLHHKADNNYTIINVTGEMDLRFNYELNLPDAKGMFFLAIPKYGTAWKALPESSVAGNCRNITALLVDYKSY